ncbi:MAG: hydrogenase maturation protease [Methanomassiliicoccaceae archaeon]|jgi:hydrogenase maturation protease|nr:hydrogenase maturation protease [Methanomassiliicoccaceae archaeon]
MGGDGRLSDNVLVIGLGSPIMTDDAIGLKVAEAVEFMGLPNVETLQEAIGGLDIIPLIMGYRNVIIVDAIRTNACRPGTIIIFDPEDFEPTVANASAHEMNLATAMRIGRQYDPDGMPESVRFVAIEVEDIMTVGETMTDDVSKALPDAVETVLQMIREIQTSI